MTIISVEELTHVYGAGTPFEKKALDAVTLSIEKGSFVGLIGHTGSGKSTLIQHLNGLLKPTSGRVVFDGEDIWGKGYDIKRLRFRVGLVFQYPEYQLFEETVYKDIAFGPKNMGLAEDEIRRRVESAAASVGLEPELLEKSPFELSGGQKRRAAIAGVLAMEPEVLILDEPTAGLDPRGRDRILSHIRDYHRSRGSTVIMVSHNMEEMARCAEEIVVMRGGRVAMKGSPRDIFLRAAELEGMGLDVPQITRVFMRLKSMGLDVPEGIFTTEEARDVIMKIIAGRGSGQ